MLRLQNKRAVSEVIGYVLLVAITLSIAAIVFVSLKTFVPKDTVQCPEGITLTLSDNSCTYTDATGSTQVQLNLNFTNTGRFSIDGYFIRASSGSEPDLIIHPLDSFFVAFDTGERVENKIAFTPIAEGLKPNGKQHHRFVITGSENQELLVKKIGIIEIIPYQNSEQEDKPIICGNARVLERITCKDAD